MLVEMAGRLGERRSDGIHVSHDLTQAHLAQLAGAARETVNRVLAKFVARGWLGLEDRGFVIYDLPSLRGRSR